MDPPQQDLLSDEAARPGTSNDTACPVPNNDAARPGTSNDTAARPAAAHPASSAVPPTDWNHYKGLRPERPHKPLILGHRHPSDSNSQPSASALPAPLPEYHPPPRPLGLLDHPRPISHPPRHSSLSELTRPLPLLPTRTPLLLVQPTRPQVVPQQQPRTTLPSLQSSQPRPTTLLRPPHAGPPAMLQGQGTRPIITTANTSSVTSNPLRGLLSPSGLIRPSTFRFPPLTQEQLDNILLQTNDARVRSFLSTNKRLASASEPPTGERPTKRLASSTVTSLPSNGILWEDHTGADFDCTLCFQQFDEPHITGCGHTYCLSCIDRFLALNPRCPKCTMEVKRENVVPNRAIYQLMRKAKNSEKALSTELATAAAHVPGKEHALADLDIQSFFQKRYKDLSMGEVEILMAMLSRKRENLLTENEECRQSLISDFLTELKRLKEAELQKVQDELNYIQDDLNVLEKEEIEKKKSKANASADKATSSTSSDVPEKSSSGDGDSLPKSLSILTDKPTESASSCSSKDPPPIRDIGFNIMDGIQEPKPSVAQRKVKIHSHFNELATMYLKGLTSGTSKEVRMAEAMETEGGVQKNKNLEDFTEALVRISRYTGFKQLATLAYTSDTLLNANIVSTIEFDKDRDFFAIAGITKKIKLFEYGSVVAAAVNMQAPNGEIICSSKISCVSYSCFYKNKLASSDYEGKVNLWDTSNCEQIASLNEHEKRVWSVDFSDGDPRFLVSGSDDCKVKLWSINQQNSGVTLNTNANVCCVKFLPGSSYMVAFGSADHCIHYYDFRQPKTPLRVYSGHKKAVSYVKFASKTELISASTDGNLKMWDLTGPDCVRSYVGHMNDKNFVGLTTDGNYVACGSENNSIYVYYKHVPYPMLSYKFENYRSMIHPVRQEEVSCEFVSAVAWRTGSPVVVAANSQGIIKVLELV